MSEFISISDYSYELPEDRIAKYPLSARDKSKLLIYTENTIQENTFSSIDEHIPDQSTVFFNNTRVIHARLLFKRITGASIEIFCLNPVSPEEYTLAFSAQKTCTWHCMVGNLKKWKDEVLLLRINYQGKKYSLEARKVKQDKSDVIVEFRWDFDLNFGELIEIAGVIPIPPYLNRNTEDIDNSRYQTVYSKHNGSVAAPTAGLHFTSSVLKKLQAKGVSLGELTLHVGAGTFKPVKSENVLDHSMHSEFFTLPLSKIESLSETSDKVIATGTTTLRTLESLYWLAVKSVEAGELKHSLDQWEYKSLSQHYSAAKVFREFLSLLIKQEQNDYSAHTRIMITPGYKFRLVDGLITNYHQPKSTLLLLIAAFIGKDWKRVYDYALKNDFRFLSYGDSSLLWRT